MEPTLEPTPTTGRPRPGDATAGAGATGSASVTGFLALVRRWRAMLVAAALAAGLVGYVVSSSGEATYESSAVLLVGPINAELDTLRASGQAAQTYAVLAKSNPVLDATGARLRLRNVGSGLSASANQVTRLLTIRVRDQDAGRGARIANAHAAALIQYVAKQRTDITAGQEKTTTTGTTPQSAEAIANAKADAEAAQAKADAIGALRVVDPAEATDVASGPGALPIALVCALAGFIGALGVALLIDRAGDALRGAEDLGGLTGAGSVGLLGRAAWRASSRPPAVVDGMPRSRAADEYRLLAAKLHAIGERSLLVLGVDDTSRGVGANLAAALAAGGSRVTLLRVDGTRSSVTLLTPDGKPQTSSQPELGEIVTADEARHVLDEQLGDSDLVLVDTPAIGQSSGALVWARVADGTLLAAQVDRTLRRDLTATAESLRLVHARLLGTVIGAPPGLLRR